MKHVTSSNALWLALLIFASAALTTVYTCTMPFSAFAVIAAATLPRRNAVVLMIAVWLVNQVVGFSALHYPWTAATFAWGAIIGSAAVISTMFAQWTIGRFSSFPPAVRALSAFVLAFASYQLTLYGIAHSVLPSGDGAFAPRIIGEVLLVNAVTFVGFVGLNQLAVAIRFGGRRAGAVQAGRFV